MRVVLCPVGKEQVHFVAPPADKIDEEMSKFLSWWDSSKGSMEGLIRAAVGHFWFVTIHPFENGNGPIAGALTDMALARDDSQKHRYRALSSQIMEERESYYDVLEACQKGSSDITQWLVWFLDCFSRAIDRSERILSGVITKAKFWRMHGQKSLSGRQCKVINKLLDAGSDGFEGGLTTKEVCLHDENEQTDGLPGNQPSPRARSRTAESG